MTGAECKAIRGLLRLTQQQLADMLGVHKITIAKREGGALQISLETELALRYLAKTRKAKHAR